MNSNTIINSVFVPTPKTLDYVRGVWVNYVVSIVCFVVLWSMSVQIWWCVLSFLFLGPVNPHTLYALHIPYGVEFTDNSITIHYCFLSLDKRKIISNNNAYFCFYNEDSPQNTRLVLYARKTKGAFKKIAFLQTNKWTTDCQNLLASYAINNSIVVLHH